MATTPAVRANDPRGFPAVSGQNEDHSNAEIFDS